MEDDALRKAMVAVTAGDPAALRKAMDTIVDVEAKLGNNTGDTLLTWAARQGQAGCLGALLELGADLRGETARGGSALFIASQEGCTPCVQLLLAGCCRCRCQPGCR